MSYDDYWTKNVEEKVLNELNELFEDNIESIGLILPYIHFCISTKEYVVGLDELVRLKNIFHCLDSAIQITSNGTYIEVFIDYVPMKSFLKYELGLLFDFSGYIKVDVKSESSAEALSKVSGICGEINKNHGINADFDGIECHGKGK